MFGKVKKSVCLALLLYAASLSAVSVLGQDRPLPKDPKDPPPREKMIPMPGRQMPGFALKDDIVTMEKSSPVDSNVVIKLCVSDGNLKINGWRRDEVRVFVRNGRRFGMKPQEKSPETGKINWLWVVNSPKTPRAVSECLAGESIEIDAPIGSTFDLTGRETRMSIDSVKKVKVRIAEGVIILRNISGGISANTNAGDLVVDNSAGAIGLETTTGNIVAIDVKPGQIGELLRAKTNGGAITLQRVEHRQIEAYSISGSVLFDGKFLSGGIYNFRTSAGSIRLAIPGASSCTFKAIYGVGQFESEIPLTIVTQDDMSQVKTVVATLGRGDAMVNLTTRTGSIGIRKAAAGKP